MAYPWAEEALQTGVANNWVPEEVSMQLDVETWKKDGPKGLSEDERKRLCTTWDSFQQQRV